MEIPEPWRNALVQVIEELETAAPGLCRWVRPEGFHITLAFLGNQPESILPAITKAMEAAAEPASPFTLHPAKLGYFGSRAAPQVVWAGVTDEPTNALDALCQRVTAALLATGVRFDEATFRPHLTLGRGRRARPAANATGLRLALESSELWTRGTAPVHEIVLFKSDLRPTGSLYTPLHFGRLSG